LCRYGARPAFAHQRLAWTADGQAGGKHRRPKMLEASRRPVRAIATGALLVSWRVW
jgi:hypothetical protein